MKSVDILSNTDRTSWSRIYMAARFYLAPVRWQLWAFPLLSIAVCVLLNVMNIKEYPTLSSVIISPLSLAMIFAPMGLGYRKCRETGAMLPALGFEKCVAILGWFLIVVPILVMAPAEILSYVIHGSSYQSELLDTMPVDVRGYVRDFTSPQTWLLNILSSGSLILTSLWGVMQARRSPMLWGFLSVVIYYFGVVIMGVITGFIIGVRAAIAHPDLADAEAEALKNVVVNEVMTTFLMATLIISAIYFIFAGAMCCRAICRRQL